MYRVYRVTYLFAIIPYSERLAYEIVRYLTS